MERIKRSNKAETLGQIITQVLQESGMNQVMLEQLAVQKWVSVVGPTAYRATLSVKAKDGVLTVKVNSSVVRQELSLMRNQIVKRYAELVGHGVIKEVQIW